MKQGKEETPFGFALDASAEAMRGIYNSLGVDTGAWATVVREWKAQKGTLGALLGPTWRREVPVEVASDGYSRKEELIAALIAAYKPPADSPYRLTHDIFSIADIETSKVQEGSPLLGVPGVKKGAKLYRALVKYLAHELHLPVEAPKGEVSALAIVGKAMGEWKKQSQGTLVLSANILDLLMVSNHCQYSSCHRWEGEYAAGPLHYLADNHTLVAYLYRQHKTEPKSGLLLPHKEWRQMVHVGPEAAQFQRQYDNPLHEDCHKVLRRMVAELLTQRMGIPVPPEPLWKHKAGGNSVECDGLELAYIDPAHCSIRLGMHYFAPVLADYAMCPSCGSSSEWKERENLGCDNCVGGHSVHCHHCNARVHEEDTISYCDGEYSLCERCYSRYYGACYRCEETRCNDDLTECEGEWYCDRCRNNNFTCCNGCDNYFRNISDGPDGESYCEDCLGNFPCCDNCGEYYEKDAHLCTVHCPTCATEAAREELNEQSA